MQIQFESGKALKFTEQDVFNEGCQPDTAQSMEVDIEFSNETMDGLLDDIKEFYGVDDDALLKNSCDEDGRLDISLLEDDNSLQASQQDIKEWKQGGKRLWNSIYTYEIKKVTYEGFSF